MSVFSEEEIQVIRAVINHGYEKAAASFSAITGKKINIKPVQIEIDTQCREVLRNVKKDENIVMITTSMIGAYEGKSYLLFSELEAGLVYQTCMPYNEDQAARLMETEALLKELDNILSATVITEFANLTNAMMFGDVPELSYVKRKAIQENISSAFNSRQRSYYLLADTHFIFKDCAELHPQFIWKLTEKFLMDVRNLSETKGHLKMIQNEKPG